MTTVGSETRLLGFRGPTDMLFPRKSPRKAMQSETYQIMTLTLCTFIYYYHPLLTYTCRRGAVPTITYIGCLLVPCPL